MKKLILLLALHGCSTPRPLVDEDLFKNELNDSIEEFRKAADLKKKDMYVFK
jgi:hypothetical protein